MSGDPVNNNNPVVTHYHVSSDCPKCGRAVITIRVPEVQRVKDVVSTFAKDKFAEFKALLPDFQWDKRIEQYKKHKVCVMFFAYYTIVFAIIGMSLRYWK